MCHAVQCKLCQKTTWSGCGQHVDMVMAGVPKAARCQGHSEQELAEYRAEHSPWRKLFKRNAG